MVYALAPQNRAPEPGESFRSPDIAATLKRIAETKGEAFYRGEIAEKIAAFFAANGGLLTADDLAAWRPEWVEPLSVNYRGLRCLGDAAQWSRQLLC